MQLRQLFSPLARPANPKLFLYDMAAHMSDSVFYQETCPVTNDPATWYKVFEEMFHSAYDTTPYLHPDTVFYKGHSLNPDTIPLGIINYAYYTFKPNALTTDTYFSFDTVNNVLTDKPGRPDWPYVEGGVFMASSLTESSYFSNPTFKISPDFLYYDNFYQSFYNGSTEFVFKIDFGDGAGWVTFDQTVTTYHQVNYSDSGLKEIQVAWFSGSNIRQISTSQFRIITGTPRRVPDAVLNFPGLTANFYGGCNGDQRSGKTVIYLSGIDIMDFLPGLGRNADRIYNEMLRNDPVIQLKNHGYNFLVVDWRNSRIDMRFNALYVVNMLEQLKCTLGDDHQFVVMGESMGGVIARYALRYMETGRYIERNTSQFFEDAVDPNNALYLALHPEIYDLPTDWCRTEKMHNTRLMITIDAPHQGANIPLSAQHAYRGAMGIFGSYIGAGLRVASTLFNLFLDGQAAQQLLIYHVDTKSGGGYYKNYSQHPDRTSFVNQLNAMGGYPQFAKTVVMSNGALDGDRQVNTYTGEPRQPNDRLLDFKAELYARVLWIKVPVFGGEIKMRTNPDGFGQAFLAQAGRYGIRIKLKWFGIRISIGYNSLLYKDELVNTRPYCVNAGGFYDAPSLVSGDPASNEFNFLGLFSYQFQNDGNGCAGLKSHLGINGFASANFDYKMCSDGGRFCFVPTASALDYGNVTTQALDLGIEGENINTKLSTVATGVDVMIGYPNSIEYRNTRVSNFPHLNMRNSFIRNITRSLTAFPNEFTYFSCIGARDDVERSMLAMEIGDEELYLENVTLPWQGVYQAEYDIHVNARNPYYEYSSQPFIGDPMLEGVYSKQEDYIIDPTSGEATFIYDKEVPPSPTGIGLNYQPPFSGTFLEINQPLFVCCQNFIGARTRPVPLKHKVSPMKDSYLKVFPNPNNGRQAVLKYKFKNSKQTSIRVEVINLAGVNVLQKLFRVSKPELETTTSLDLQSANLSSGMYILRITNGSEIQTAKIIISK
ncbi:MAG TPA: T9SS type A sorting domain-containing protein [Flavisolibacter sp.]|nr:T9SS type A sorting domain-containing protein [Flavisolibacter sp.]